MKHAKDNSNLKVISGQPLKAELWNRVIDRLPNNDVAVGTSVSLINKSVVQCKAHVDIDIAEVWAVDSYLGVTDDIYEIAPSHILDVTPIVWPANCHKLVVAERPVKQDEIGPFAYNGGTIVNLAAGVGDYAFPDPDNATGMKRGSSGYRILNLVGEDKAVVSLGDVQPLWLYELTESYTGGTIGTGHILTLYSEQFSSSPVTINFEMDCRPEALPVGHIGYCMFADGAFWAIDNCATGGTGTQTKRVRFVLENKFNDTGQALANVLDTFGNTGLIRGDQVVVNDPRKLFAHAVGYSNMNFTPQTVSDFPCGGSIGYAVWTEAPDTDPPSTADYPRYEVEQCTQTVDRMKVYVYESGSSTSGQDKSRPTGEMPTNQDMCWLYFNDRNNFASRWPDVDYCESWQDVTDPEILPIYKYKVLASNPHRFSAKRGSWCIIEKNTTPQRPQDACNDITPYAGTGDPTPEWVIVEVELPIARWIAVTFDTKVEDQDKWSYASEWAEGEDPSVAYFPDDVPINDRIRTAPTLDSGCLVKDEPGWAFWDPNEQHYNVVVTNSALYGTAVEVKAVATTELADPLLAASECEITFKQLSTFSAFGIREGVDPNNCEPEITDETINMGLVPQTVVAGVTRVGDTFCFDYEQIYVCKSVPAADECLYVCCDDPPVGCCVVTYDTGSVDYLYPKTEAECAAYLAQPSVVTAVWTLGPCDEPPPEGCCESVSAATEVTQAFYNFTGFMGDTTEGHFVVGSSSTSLTGECGITITFDVLWSNGTCQAQQTTQAIAVLRKNGTCCYWEVTLTQPTAQCQMGMGTLGDGWPSSVVKIIGCSGTGEFDQDCQLQTGDCAAVCDNGGFGSVQLTVDNIGGCIT
jgi:hypothetical protein